MKAFLRSRDQTLPRSSSSCPRIDEKGRKRKKKMINDVEMKEVQATFNSVSSGTASSTLQHLKEIASLIETGAYAKGVRRIVRAVRLTMMLPWKLRSPVVSAFLSYALAPVSDAHSRLSSYLTRDAEHDMDVDTTTSAARSGPAKVFSAGA